MEAGPEMDDLTRFQMGPEGPVQIARIWIEAVVRDKDLRAAWPITHPQFREELVEAWVNANTRHVALAGRDLDDLRRALTSPAPEDPLWEGFEESTLGEFADYWSFLDLDSWGWMSDPRPHGPDSELVYLIDMDQLELNEADGHYEIPEDTHAPATGLLMKLLDKASEYDGVEVSLGANEENRWRVADLSARATGGGA